MAGETPIYNANTQEIMSRIPVTTWRDGTVLTTANQGTYLGGIYDQDSTGYFKYGFSGLFPLSRITVTQANFQKLINDFGTTPASILIDTNLTIATNLTTPANINLFFDPGALIIINSGIVLTIQGSVFAGEQQIFSLGAALTTNVLMQGNDVIQVDWFGIGNTKDGSCVQNDSIAIQKAVNAAYKSTLQFTKGKIYRFINVYLPADITIDGNGALLRPNLFTSYSGYALFYLSPNRINPSTGLYNGGISYLGTAALPLNVNNIQIMNCFYDAEGSNKGFCGLSNSSLTYSVIKYIKLYNNEIINCCCTNVINISGAANVNDTTGYIQTCDIEKNTVKWSGANQGLIVKADYAIGATSIDVKTIDNRPIDEHCTVMVGRFIQIGSSVVPTEAAGSYIGTAAVYQITAFTCSSTDKTEGTISIASGVYNTTNGWVVDSTNQGLKAYIVTNAWLLPISATRFPLATTYPSFTGGANPPTSCDPDEITSSILTRSSTTTIQNAYANNLFVGLKFSFINGCSGVYTIQSIDPSDGSITVTPGLAVAVTAQTIYIDGNLTSSAYFGGDIRNLNIGFNVLIGGSHAISLSGTSLGAGYYPNALRSYFRFYDNIMEYNSMNMEAVRGSTDPYLTDSVFKALFDGMTLTAGCTTITLPTPTTYRVAQKDLNGDGIAENVLTLASTIDANITTFNSLTAGDIFTFDGLKGVYMITNVPTDWSSGTITISRWDVLSKANISGGLINGTVSALSQGGSLNARVYSNALGSAGTFRQLNFKRNKFRYPIDSYHLSLTAEEFIIENNDFEMCERTMFEFGGNKLIFTGNNIKATIFIEGAGLAIPASVNSTSGKGFGGLMSLSMADIKITNNSFDYYQPATSLYNVLSGVIAHTKNTHYVDGEQRLIVKNNTFFGAAGDMTASNSNRTIVGSTQSYDTVAYDYFEFDNNTIVYNNIAANPLLRSPHGLFSIITNNKFYLAPHAVLSWYLFSDMPNPEIFGAGPYNVVVNGNQYLNSTSPRNVCVNNNATLLANISYGDNSHVSSINKNFGTAIPATGTYLKGSIVFNINYDGSTSTIIYWICTVAGTPGTWLGVTP